MNGKINEINNRLPTEKDLSTHLSTIFTENRLKNILNLDQWIPVVGIVCVPDLLLTGILYGNLDEVHNLILNGTKIK